MSQNNQAYLDQVYSNLLQYLLDNRKIDESILNTFFIKGKLVELTDRKAVLLSDSYISKQIMQKETETLSSVLQELTNNPVPYEIEIEQADNYQKKKELVEKPVVFVEDEFGSMPLNEDRTFDNFIEGDCNRESRAAALACAYGPGSYYNPLFIYGNSGLGKTHLLMSIGNYVKKNYPTKKVYYIESLKFVDRVVKAIQSNRIDYFKQYMCSMDLLLVDDIQFLAGKEKSHEIFFSIYNELVNNHKQICIVSDRQPKEIKGLEDRLISRFNSGLSVGIDSPEFETSLAILKSKIKNSCNIEDVDDRGLEYIASNFSGNIRDLEGALNRVLFYSIMYNQNNDVIPFETVVDALKNQAVVSDKTGLSPSKIIKTVADYYNLTSQQITGKTRTKNIANARHIAIYLCRKMLDLPYIKIGELFGGRDHSTIISACTKVEKQLEKDSTFKFAVDKLESSLQS